MLFPIVENVNHLRCRTLGRNGGVEGDGYDLVNLHSEILLQVAREFFEAWSSVRGTN